MNKKHGLKSIWKEYIFHNDKIIFVVAGNVLMLITSILVPFLIGKIIDDGLIARQYFYFYKFIAALVLCYAIGKLSSYFVTCWIAKIHFLSEIKFNLAIIEHVQKLPLAYLNKQDMVYLNTRIYQDCDSIIGFALDNFISSVFSILIVFLLAVLVAAKDVWIAVALFLTIVIYVVIYMVYGAKIYEKFRIQKETLNNFFAKLTYLLTNVKFIKINSLADYVDGKISNSIGNVIKRIIVYVKTNWMFTAYCDVIKYCFLLFYIYYGGVLVFNNKLLVGEFVVVIGYINILFENISVVLEFSKSYKETRVAFDRVNDILLVVEESSNGNILNYVNSIQVKDLTFGFDKKSNLFKEFNYEFRRGYSYCIVGKNGRGKSTFLMLLIGLLKPQNGNILYDGIDIQKLNMEKMRKFRIGFSEQEPVLIGDTVKESIFYDNENIHVDNELYEYLGNNLLSMIEKEAIDNFMNLSGGEKQKISQLRVFVKNCDVLILDEPSSALDEKSKRKLLKIINMVKNKKIVIIVSHDKNIIDTCDFCLNL